jgi:hypothetical protein
MKLVFFLILFFCVANSYSQIITTDKLIGSWVTPNNNFIMAVFEFVDNTHLRMMEHEKYIDSGGLTYRLEHMNNSNLLRINAQRVISKNKTDSCFLTLTAPDTLIMSGGFFNYIINQVRDAHPDAAKGITFYDVKYQFCRKKP